MKKLLESFFENYLSRRNIEKTLAFVTESVITIGTGEHEIAKSKEAFRKLLEAEFTELPEPLPYEIYDYYETDSGENIKNVLAKLRVRLERDGNVTEMKSRLTCTCVKEDNEWKISIIHMSTSESEQEKDSFFPLYYGKNVVGKLTPGSNAKLMELISDSIPGGIMGGYLEKDYPLYTINNKMLDILGYTYEELLAATDEKMLNVIYADDRERVEESIKVQFEKNNEYQIEYRVVGKDNKIIWVNDIGKKIITDDGREAMISIMTDISDRVEKEKQLKYEAEHDPLTRLNNRKNAVRLMEEELKKSNGGHFFICDVDNFKSVNDTKGHATGDNILIQLAVIIQNQAGEDSITARLGGDEYILFFPEKYNGRLQKAE